MTKKIFLNYRREDARSDAGRLYDQLVAAFGNENVFMDVDDLLAGQRFDAEMNKALLQCDVLLVVIGPRWLDILKSRKGPSEQDYVRREIAAGLKRGVVVVPILIDNTQLPRADDLPEDIRELVEHQKHEIRF